MVVISFLLYVCIKINRRKYLFSIFNIGVYIYFFSIVISPIFFYYNESWLALRISSACSMWDYLNESMCINLIGFLFFILFLLLFEFKSHSPTFLINYSERYNRYISDLSINLFFIVFVILFVYICLLFCHGFPLFNLKRTFYLNTGISPVYLFVNQGIYLFSLYYGIRFVLYKKNLFFCLLGFFCLIMQGNRGVWLLGVLFPLLVIYIYQIYFKKSHNVAFTQYKLISKKVTKKIFFLVPFFVIMGIFTQFVRKGAYDVSIIMFFHELVFGNTFSDIRDGAFILSGFDNEYDFFLMGKTYLSALISFIPSSFSDFRYTWSWGRFTTGLFNFQNHFGLRGGNSLEAYLNFSWLAVIIVSFFQAIIISKLELVFYTVFILKKYRFLGKEIFIYYILLKFYSCLSSSSASYDIYSTIFILLMLRITTKLLKFSFRYRLCYWKRLCKNVV